MLRANNNGRTSRFEVTTTDELSYATIKKKIVAFSSVIVLLNNWSASINVTVMFNCISILMLAGRCLL